MPKVLETFVKKICTEMYDLVEDMHRLPLLMGIICKNILEAAICRGSCFTSHSECLDLVFLLHWYREWLHRELTMWYFS